MKRLLVVLVGLALATPALAEKTEGVIPGVLIGPKLGIVNVPTPTVGVETMFGRWVGLSFDYGAIPDVKVKEYTGSMTNWYAGARVFPFRGSFFVGGLYGHRDLKIRVKGNVNEATEVTGRSKASASYLAPELGWRFIWDSGFSMGLDLGWQFVIRHEASLNVPAGFDADKAKDLADAVDEGGKTGLPVLGLLQLAYFF